MTGEKVLPDLKEILKSAKKVSFEGTVLNIRMKTGKMKTIFTKIQKFKSKYLSDDEHFKENFNKGGL